jgi:hypothetical protein
MVAASREDTDRDDVSIRERLTPVGRRIAVAPEKPVSCALRAGVDHRRYLRSTPLTLDPAERR